MKFTVLILSVVTAFWGCDDLFEKDISEKEIVVVAPAPNVVTAEKEQLFLWEELEGADSYLLRIVTPSFEAAARCLVDTVVRTNRFEYTLPAGEYEWSLQGANSAWQSIEREQKLTIIEEAEDEGR